MSSRSGGCTPCYTATLTLQCCHQTQHTPGPAHNAARQRQPALMHCYVRMVCTLGCCKCTTQWQEWLYHARSTPSAKSSGTATDTQPQRQPEKQRPTAPRSSLTAAPHSSCRARARRRPHQSASRPSIALSLSAQHTAALWWPLYMRMASPVDRSHSRALQSDDAVTRYAASTEKTQSQTQRWWPARPRGACLGSAVTPALARRACMGGRRACGDARRLPEVGNALRPGPAGMRGRAAGAAGRTHERAVEREAVQVPELDRLVRGRRGQLAHVRAQQALEHVLACAAPCSGAARHRSRSLVRTECTIRKGGPHRRARAACAAAQSASSARSRASCATRSTCLPQQAGVIEGRNHRKASGV